MDIIRVVKKKKKDLNAAFYSAEALAPEPVFPDPANPGRQQPGRAGTGAGAGGSTRGGTPGSAGPAPPPPPPAPPAPLGACDREAGSKPGRARGQLGVALSPPTSSAIGRATGADGVKPPLLQRNRPTPLQLGGAFK